MIDEWKIDQELNHTNHSPWAIFKKDYHDFDYYLENLEVKEPKDGKVTDSLFFLLEVDRNILLGAVNIRHYLNDYFLKFVGHIGDGIRSSEYGKGYATETHFSVVIYNVNYNNVENGVTNGVINDVINGALNENEKIVYGAMKANPQITIAEIVQKARISRRTVERIIARLKEKKLIERSGANKGGY